MRYRRLQALVIVSLASLVAACVVFAPLYDRAIQQATVQTRLHEAPVQVSGLTLTSRGNTQTKALEPAALKSLVPKAVRPYLLAPINSITVTMLRPPANDPSGPIGSMMWRQGMCAHVRFVSGHCPTDLDTVAVSTADAHNFGWHIGSRFRLQEVVIDPEANKGAPAAASPKMTVAGIYIVRSGPYWFGQPPVGRSGTPVEGKGRPQVDGWLTTRETVDGSRTAWIGPVDEADFALDEPAVGIDQILRLGPVLDRFTAAPYATREGELFQNPQLFHNPPDVIAYSGLPDIAKVAVKGRDQARVTVPLLMVQLGLLAVVVLWLVLGAATEQRRPEVAVARLRGRGVGGARRLLLAELGTMVLAGVPLGVLVALGLSWLARHAFLPLTPPFELGVGFLIAVGVVVVVLAVVTATAVQQVAREPVAALLRRVPTRRTTWAVGALDAMVVAACLTAVIAFVTGGLTGPIALAAPGLLALLVGLVLAHLLVPVAAAAGRRLLARGHVAAGVSALHVARRPATRRVVTIVTVAAGLLVFSADALAVGDRNREYAADQEVGAARVATIAGQDVAAVQAALPEADPVGHSVTPVVTISPPNPAGTTTQAVIPDQYSHIALLPGQSAASIPWRRLAAPAVKPLRLTGTWVSFSLASRVSTKGREGGGPQLSLRLVGRDRQEQERTAADLPDGSRAPHRMRVGIPCAGGCDLAGLRVDADPLAPARGSFELADLVTSSGQHVAAGPGRHWVATSSHGLGFMRPSSARTPVGSPALRVTFSAAGAGPVVMDHASIPRWLPALVAGALPPGTRGNRFAGLDLDGVNRAMVRVARLPRVPGAPANTALVNLQVLQRGGAVLDPTGTVQVWFARDDPVLLARVTRALHAHGLSVSGTTSVSAAGRTLDRSAAAWSLALALVVGVAGLLVAVLVLVVVAATTWRLRSRDFAALRMSGLSRGQISLVAAGEQVPVVALAVVVGAVCGAVGAHFAMPTVPLFATAPQVSTLDLATAWPTVLAAAGLSLVLLCAAGWAAAWSLAGRADLSRVRESL